MAMVDGSSHPPSQHLIRALGPRRRGTIRKAVGVLKAAVAVSSVRRQRAGFLVREARDGFLFTLPFLLGVTLFWVGPMLYSIFLVTQDWTMLSPPRFVGLGNFRQLLEDELIATALWNTSYYTFLGVPLQLTVAFALAVALNQGIRGTGVYRTIFYLPSITPVVASAVVWLQIFNTDFGVLNNFLVLFGIPRLKWLWNPVLAKPAFILMSLWSVGPAMVIFLAALQNVPVELLEAAQIDGAGSWARFRHITIPMVSPVLLFNMVMGIIGSFQVFTASFVMTGGGPQNATLFAVLYIYHLGFRMYKMGFAATLSWVLFAIIMVFTVIQVRLSNRWVYYEYDVE